MSEHPLHNLSGEEFLDHLESQLPGGRWSLTDVLEIERHGRELFAARPVLAEALGPVLAKIAEAGLSPFQRRVGLWTAVVALIAL